MADLKLDLTRQIIMPTVDSEILPLSETKDTTKTCRAAKHKTIVKKILSHKCQSMIKVIFRPLQTNMTTSQVSSSTSKIAYCECT